MNQEKNLHQVNLYARLVLKIFDLVNLYESGKLMCTR